MSTQELRNLRLSPIVQLGQAVAQYRVLVAKVSQKDFAATLGISKPTLVSIEKGDPGVSAGTLFKIFAIMGIDFKIAELAKDSSLQIGVTEDLSAENLKELFNDAK